MKKSIKLVLFIFICSIQILTPVFARPRGRVAWYGPGFIVDRWNHGYWFHGAYSGRVGWWWIVGPTWYYYAAPAYPYPSYQTAPQYYVQISAPPPPAAPLPSTTQNSPVAVLPAPPAQGSASAATAGPPKAGTKSAFSYYCEKSKSYYPVVNACEDGWIATPIQAPE